MNLVKNAIGNSAFTCDALKTNEQMDGIVNTSEQMDGTFSTRLTMPNGEKVGGIIAAVAVSLENRQAQEYCKKIKNNIRESNFNR